MRNITFLLIVLTCMLGSCTNRNPSHKPTDGFENFAGYLDTAGYISDIERTRKIGADDLKKASVFHSGKKTFFILDPGDHLILRNKTNWGLNVPVDYESFENALFISAYYYYSKNRNAVMREDGVMEEWHFPTTAEAKKALQEFNRIKSQVYFNTDSFSFHSKNCLYIFHTRAAAFDETLEQFCRALQARI